MRSKIYRISSSSVRRQKDDYRGMVVFRMYVMRLLLGVFVGLFLNLELFDHANMRIHQNPHCLMGERYSWEIPDRVLH